MSNKSARKVKLPSPAQAPRLMADIEKEYQQYVLQSGQIQYQITIYTRELAQLNTHLESLNREAAARKELDAATPPSAPKAEGAQNVAL